VVVLLTALVFVVRLDVGKSYIWFVVLALMASMLTVLGLNYFYRMRGGGVSAWMRPASDSTGARILAIAMGAWLILVGLLTIAMLIIGFRSAPLLGIFVGCLSLAGIAVGRLLQKRSVTKSLLPYGISLTLALMLMTWALSISHVIHMSL
jgi:hypothetical protein